MNGITMRMLTRPREEGEEERRPEETRRRRERDWPEERRTEAYGYPMERRMTAVPYRHQPDYTEPGLSPCGESGLKYGQGRPGA